MNEIIFFLLALTSITYGIIDLMNSKKKFDSFFYNGIHYILMGILGLLSIIIFYYEGASIRCLFAFCITFIFSGFFGLYFRKNIKNSLTLKMDIGALIAGIIGLIPIFLYFIGYFDK